jgi:hypothetical protein
LTGAAAEAPTDAQLADAPLTDAPWSLEPGAAIGPYERPSRFEKNAVRTLNNPKGQPGAQGARTPHHLMNGVITPNGLHFVVSWGGAPDIDPDKHRLAIHGLPLLMLTASADDDVPRSSVFKHSRQTVCRSGQRAFRSSPVSPSITLTSAS